MPRIISKPPLKQCSSCQHAIEDPQQGNFRIERRVAYREVGSRAENNLSRGIAVQQEVLVCIYCGHVEDELSYVRG